MMSRLGNGSRILRVLVGTHDGYLRPEPPVSKTARELG